MDSDTEKKEVIEQRQDAYVIFANEKDLRHFESIRIKASLYTGIAVRVKNMTPGAMDNLLHAIELDAAPPEKKEKKKDEIKEELLKDAASKQGDKKTEGKKESARAARPLGCIVNLRFEECRFSRKAAATLSEFMKTKQILETLGFCRISFEDIVDFKKILECVQQNQKL